MIQDKQSFFNPKQTQNQTNLPKPQKTIVGKFFDNASWLLSRPFTPIGTGIGDGLVSGVKDKMEQMVQPNGPLGIQLKQTLEQALLNQPPEGLPEVVELLNKISKNEYRLTYEEFNKINGYLITLKKEDNKLLKQLLSDLNEDGIQFCKEIFNAFKACSEKAKNDDYADDEFIEFDDKEFVDGKLKEFTEILTVLLKRNQGALIQSLSHLQHALLSEENGILSEAVELLKKKCTDENTGLMKKVVDQLSQLLNKEGGPLDVFAEKLTGNDQSIIGKAISLLNTKLLEKGGIVDKIGERFNDEETGIITKALSIAQNQFDTILEKGLTRLKEELSSETGIMANLKEKVSGKEGSIISDAIKILNENLFQENTGIVDKFRDALTNKERGILTEALKLVAKELNDEKDGIFVKGIELLKAKLTGENGFLPEAVKLLEEKLNGKEGVIEKLQNRLLNEKDGALTQALSAVQDKLNNKETGILAQSLQLLQNRLLAEDGIVDALEKKLTNEENGLLVTTVKQLQTLLTKEGGPLTAIDAQLQKSLATSLELLKQKCLDEKEGLLADGLKLLNEKLNGKEGIVEKLQHRLLNEKDGALTQALATVQDKLNNEQTGIFAQSLLLLQSRLLDKNGLVDTLEKKLTNEENGLLVTTVKQLQTLLTKEGGPLTAIDGQLQKSLASSLELLKQKCLDEKEGLLAQSLKLLNEKLNAENGVLDTLSKRLNDPNDGILAKAVSTLNQKLLDEEIGTVALLQKKLLGDEGLVPKAIAMLDSKLRENIAALEKKLTEKDGTIDKTVGILQNKFMGENGLLDQAMGLIDSRLNDQEKGILIRAKKFLSDSLMDEKEGVIAKAIDLLNTKLRAKDGPLDYLESRLTDKESGILIKAANFFQNKMLGKGGVIEQIDDRLTMQAHPLFSSSRSHLIELRKALDSKNLHLIKKHSKELETDLAQLIDKHLEVFSRLNLANDDLELLKTLKNQLPIFYGENLPDLGQIKLAVEAGLGVMNRYWASHEGVMSRTGDILLQKLEGPITRLENILPSNINNLFGGGKPSENQPSSNPVAGGDQNANAGNKPAGEGTASNFLSQWGSKLIAMGTGAISKQVLSVAAGAITIGLNQVLSKIANNPLHEKSEEALKGLIATLSNPNETTTWAQLGDFLQKAATTEPLNSLNVTLNGFSIFGPSPKEKNVAEAALNKNVSMLEGVKEDLTLNPQGSETKKEAYFRIWENQSDEGKKALIAEERDLLIYNTSHLLAMKHIFEKVCKLKPNDDSFYFDILKAAKTTRGLKPDEIDCGFKRFGLDESRAALKKAFFDKLSEGKVNFITKIWAHIQYFFYISVVMKFTRDAATVYFEEIDKYISKQRSNGFENLRNEMLTNFTRYLTILGGAYTNVAKKERLNGTIDEMIGGELASKESNLGFDTNELYTQFAQTVLKKTTGSGFLAWIAGKIIGNPEKIVQEIIDKATGSIIDTNGYTHALNTVISDQLDEVWEKLKKGDVDKDKEIKISDFKKGQLTTLVKNLFDILRRSKCQTIPELKAVIENRDLRGEINKSIESVFIQDVLERVTTLLAVTTQSMIGEDKLNKLTYKFASLANRSFEAVPKAHGQDQEGHQLPIKPHQVELKIAQRSQQILRHAVDKAVENRFDSISGDKQQKETNGFIQILHEKSTQYLTKAEQDLSSLAKNNDLASVSAKNKINAIVEDAYDYETNCNTLCHEAKVSNIRSDNKNKINERYLGIANESKPLIKAIRTIKNCSKKIEDFKASYEHINEVRKIIAILPTPLFLHPEQLTLQQIDGAETHVKNLEVYLNRLEKMSHLKQHVEKITDEKKKIATILVNLGQAVKMRSLASNLIQPNSIIEQLVAEKKQNLGQIIANINLQTKFTSLKELLKDKLKVSMDLTLNQQLMDKLDKIESATLVQEIDTAYQEFNTLLRGSINNANETIQVEKGKFTKCSKTIGIIINETGLLDRNFIGATKEKAKAAIAEAQIHLGAFKAWEEKNNKEISYVNITPLTPENIKWIQDGASELIYGRIKDHMDGFMGLIKRKETYKYGLLNHLLLIPYNKANSS